MGRDKHALITGLFLIVFVLGITAIVYWIGHFERQRNIYVVSTRKSVSGLNPESTVFYRGIAVGKVITIKFDPIDSGIILVPIEVDKDILFTKGVFATLRLKGVTGLTHEAQNLSIKTVDLVNTGEATIDILLQTTLPRVNKVLVELQSTAQQIKRAATMLDNNPQALLLGSDHVGSGPGESGYREESK